MVNKKIEWSILCLTSKTYIIGTLKIKIFISVKKLLPAWHDFYSIIITKDLFEHGVLHSCEAEKNPQYLIWVMPAQGNSKRLKRASFN
jgi:hypothetical protein